MPNVLFHKGILRKTDAETIKWSVVAVPFSESLGMYALLREDSKQRCGADTL